jgi:hypothetical protein
MKRGRYATKHVTRDRKKYDQEYYRRNRAKILAQHRLNYIVTKGEKHGSNEVQGGV